MGRPSLGKGVSPRLDLRVEPELADALHKRAKKEHRSVSEVAREALRRYLAS
ncbi:MAG: ribbon-helix-helix protein, CopG family [Nitrososphaerales archaeon]